MNSSITGIILEAKEVFLGNKIKSARLIIYCKEEEKLAVVMADGAIITAFSGKFSSLIVGRINVTIKGNLVGHNGEFFTLAESLTIHQPEPVAKSVNAKPATQTKSPGPFIADETTIQSTEQKEVSSP
jgi:hypothetical protein